MRSMPRPVDCASVPFHSRGCGMAVLSVQRSHTVYAYCMNTLLEEVFIRMNTSHSRCSHTHPVSSPKSICRCSGRVVGSTGVPSLPVNCSTSPFFFVHSGPPSLFLFLSLPLPLPLPPSLTPSPSGVLLCKNLRRLKGGGARHPFSTALSVVAR